MNAISQHPTATLATSFAVSALIAWLVFALSPFLGAFLTPTGAQALIFWFILLAICSGTGCSLSALQDYL